MLTLSGLNRFYFIPSMRDMRCKYPRLIQIIKQSLQRNPLEGEVFIFMSKNQRKVKLISFETHAYNLYEKCYLDNYRFMKVTYQDQRPYYSIEWKAMVAILESPIIKSLKVG
jgi:hypothetical protein